MNLQDLTASVHGECLTQGSVGYDAARSVWNAMIDSRPAVIVKCTGAADVVQSLAFARANGLRVSVRGGGHNVAGLALCEGGLTIDLSRMRGIRIDAAARRVRAEAWVTWGTQVFPSGELC